MSYTLKYVLGTVAAVVVGTPIVAGFLLAWAYIVCNGQTNELPYWPF